MTADPGNRRRGARRPLAAVFDRDPACKAHIEALLFYKGFQALECHRIAHWLWHQNRRAMARYFQTSAFRRCSGSTSIPPRRWARAS